MKNDRTRALIAGAAFPLNAAATILQAQAASSLTGGVTPRPLI